MLNIRLFIVCEHQGTRRGLSAIFVTGTGFEIAGEAGYDSNLVDKVQRIQPDAILFEIRSCEESIELIRLIKESCPYTKVFIFVDNETGKEAHAAISLGVDGYLAKTMLPCHLVKVVELTCRTGIICLPGSLKHLVSSWNNNLEPTLPGQDKKGWAGNGNNGEVKCNLPLTAREVEIYKLITQNCSNKEIGGKLYISQPTVKSHVSNILRKMGFKNRTELLLYEMQHKSPNGALEGEKVRAMGADSTV